MERIAAISEITDGDVIVTNTRGAHAATIAEHTFGMLISLTRHFPRLFQAQQEHEWLPRFDSHPVGLSNLTLGMIGLGNIGRAIAKRGKAFDMKVIAVDTHKIPQPDFVTELSLSDGLPELLRRADVVVVTTLFTPQTAGMLKAQQLAQMKPTAYLLVVSRGGIVDEGRLAGAGLDVTATEPLSKESPLWHTPHLTPYTALFWPLSFYPCDGYKHLSGESTALPRW